MNWVGYFGMIFSGLVVSSVQRQWAGRYELSVGFCKVN